MAYPLLKLLHIAAAVIFLGNITTGAFWVRHAARPRRPDRLAEAMDGIVRSDAVFTLPAVAVLAASGIGTAMAAGFPLDAGWIAWGAGLLAVSGLLYLPLAFLQRRLRDVARRAGDRWEACAPLLLRWNVLGLASLLAAWGAMAAMVLKIPR